MNAIKRTPLTVAATTALAAATLTALPANAQTGMDVRVFSNSANTVRCQVITQGGKTFTRCVSDIGREKQPECNPPEQLIPSVSIEPNYTGTNCWNQGFGIEPTALKPFQIQRHGSATVIPGISGDLYVFDIAKLALIRAGKANSVVLSVR